MGFQSGTVTIGESTKKSSYDQLLDNTQDNRSEIITLKSGTVIFTGPKTFQSATVFNALATFNSSTVFNSTATFSSSILPTTALTSGTYVVPAADSYVLPRGIWNISLYFAHSNGGLILEIYVSGSWRFMAKSTSTPGSDDSLGCGVFSDGTNVRVRNTAPANTNSFYYQRF